MTKYFIYALILAVLVFGTMNWFNLKSKRNFKSLNKSKDLTILADSIKLADLNLKVYNLETALQTKDTIHDTVAGKTIIKYLDPTVTDSTQILIDSLRNDDLSLKWQINYSGKIFSFIPKWETFTKTITVNHVVKEPYPVEVIKEVPINKHLLYVSAEVLFIDKPSTFIGIEYFDLKGFKYGASIDPFNKIYMGKVGYRLFRF